MSKKNQLKTPDINKSAPPMRFISSPPSTKKIKSIISLHKPSKLLSQKSLSVILSTHFDETSEVPKIQHQSNLFEYLLKAVQKEKKATILTNSEEKKSPLRFLNISRCIVHETLIPLFSENMKMLWITECGLKNKFLVELANKKFTLLERLDLSGNQLTEIPFFKLPSLKELILANNQIDQFETLSLSKSTKLEKLDVSQNCLDLCLVTFKASMMHLKKTYPQLKDLNVLQNPFCQNLEIYEVYIFFIFREQLEILNGESVAHKTSKEHYSQYQNQIMRQKKDEEMSHNLNDLEFPIKFSRLIEILNNCLKRPNQLMGYLKSFMKLVEHLVKKSDSITCTFLYEIKDNQHSLTRELSILFNIIRILLEQNHHIDSLLIEILVKMGLFNQPNFDFASRVFEFLFSLLENSDESKDLIIKTLQQENILNFLDSSLEKVRFGLLKQYTRILAYSGPSFRVVSSKFHLIINSWFEQLLDEEKDLQLGHEDFATLGDFLGVSLLLGLKTPKFDKYIKELYLIITSKFNFYEILETDIMGKYLFFLRLIRYSIHIQIGQFKQRRKMGKSPISSMLSQASSDLSILEQSATTSLNSLISQNSSMIYNVKSTFLILLLEENNYNMFVDHLWRFYQEISYNIVNKLGNPVWYLEIFNLMTVIFADLLVFTHHIHLESNPYNFNNGFNLFSEMFKQLSTDSKNLEFKTILMNLLVRLFRNEYSLFF